MIRMSYILIALVYMEANATNEKWIKWIKSIETSIVPLDLIFELESGVFVFERRMKCFAIVDAELHSLALYLMYWYNIIELTVFVESKRRICWMYLLRRRHVWSVLQRQLSQDMTMCTSLGQWENEIPEMLEVDKTEFALSLFVCLFFFLLLSIFVSMTCI